MQYHDFPFWHDTYTFCRDVAKRARQGMQDKQPLWRTLESAASDVPVVLISAASTQSKKELRETILDASAGLQLMARLLFVCGARGQMEAGECCEYLRRCTEVCCAVLAWIERNCA